jgi:hypothetical protein
MINCQLVPWILSKHPSIDQRAGVNHCLCEQVPSNVVAGVEQYPRHSGHLRQEVINQVADWILSEPGYSFSWRLAQEVTGHAKGASLD